MSEEQFLKDCIKGNLRAQKQFYDTYARKMFVVCLRYAANDAQAQDFLQEGFIKVFDNLRKYRQDGSLEGWIRKIIVSKSLELLRRKDALDFVDIYESEKLLNDTTAHAQTQTESDAPGNQELLEAMRTLPAGYRTIFNLYAMEGYSHKEIGNMLNITESTSKSQYSRARTLLQQRLKIYKTWKTTTE